MWAQLILPLKSGRAEEQSIVGTKAVGLHLLLQHGFPVPPGYCLLPAGPNAGAANTPRGLPLDFRRAVAHAYDRLGGLVAVRCSRPAGMKAGTSTRALLGINGEDATTRAVARCITSVYEENTCGLCPVIVQQLLDSIASGTAYSRNPDNGDETEIVITGRWGIDHQDLRDHPVDRFRMRKYPLLLLTTEIATKTQEVRAGPVGIVHRPLPQSRRMVPCLTERQVLQLAALVRQVENKLAFPVQLDWALTAKGFMLLQLQTFTPPMEDFFYITPEKAGGDTEILTSPGAGIPPDVISPLAWDLISRAASAFLQPLLGRFRLPRTVSTRPLILVAGRVYLCRANLLQSAEEDLGLTPGTLDRLNLLGTCWPHGNRARRCFGLIRPAIKLTTRFPALWKTARRHGSDKLQDVLNAIEEECLRLDRIAAEQLSDTQLAQMLETIESFMLAQLEPIILGDYLESRRFRRFLTRLRRWCGPGGDVMGAQLVTGLGTLENARPGLVLWEIAHMIRESSSLPPLNDPLSFLDNLRTSEAGCEIAAALADFQHKFGHHCPGELDPAVPRWGDDPAEVVREVQAFTKLPEKTGPADRVENQIAVRSAATAWIDGRLTTGWRRLFFWRRGRMQKAANRLLAAYPILDNARSAAFKLLWRYRQYLLRAGRVLAGRGLLNPAEDIFMLRGVEIGLALAGKVDADHIRRLIRRRREAFKYYGGLHPPLTIKGSYSLSDFATPAADSREVLQGFGVSPGRYQGRARLIRSASDLHSLHPGEILVAPQIDAGWGPLLLRAAGVVTELGGEFSEAALIAREYGLPAVVGAADATAGIINGDHLELDGETGLVKVVAHHA